MLIEPTYRGWRIEVTAAAEGQRWNADVRLLRLFSPDKPRVEKVTCLTTTAEHAERAGVLWAKRWIDIRANDWTTH